MAVGISSSHGVDELSSGPFPCQVPVVKASQGVIVVYGDLGKVVS